MKNGDVYEFVDRIYYGDELWFIYDGKKYFLEGWLDNNTLNLYLYEMTENGETYIWQGDAKNYPVDAFIKAKIWHGKSFWEVEHDMTWVD